MTPLEDVLLFAIAQQGDRYVFGTEVNPLQPESDKWDCSELVEIACAQAGVIPRMPDGAYYQWRHCGNHGLAVSVAQGLSTRGALLFVGDGSGVGRDAITHVAWSLGNGLTVEARGSAWGVGSWASAHRFNFAGLMPGVDYTPRQQIQPSSPLVIGPETSENDMRPFDIQITTDPNGHGYFDLNADPHKVISLVFNTANPPDSGYKPTPDWARLNIGGKARIVLEEALPNGRIDATVWVAS